MNKIFLNRYRLLIPALQTASIFSIFIAIVPRVLFYDFPVSVAEEFAYFVKIYALSVCVIMTALAAPIMLYKLFLNIRMQAGT